MARPFKERDREKGCTVILMETATWETGTKIIAMEKESTFFQTVKGLKDPFETGKRTEKESNS